MMNRAYWRKAGNPRWGWNQLMKDVRNYIHPRKPLRVGSNNKYREQQKDSFTDNLRQDTNRHPSVVNNFTYNTAPTSMNKRKFGFMDVGKIIFITLLCGFCVAVGWMLITNPQALVEKIYSLVDVVKSIL